MKKQITSSIAIIAIAYTSYAQSVPSKEEYAAQRKAQYASMQTQTQVQTLTQTQVQTQTPEPEFGNTPMWLDEANNTLKNFERPAVNAATSMSGPISANQYVFLSGMTSPTRFNAQKLPKIYIKTMSESIDPYSILKLISFIVNPKKMQREYIYAKGIIGRVGTTITSIPVDFRKVSTGVYEIVFSAPLSKGEYAFAIGTQSPTSATAFCFTVYDGYDNAQTQGSDEKGRPVAK